MSLRCLGCVLLVWFPGVLRAQSAAWPCRTPTLDGGYFVPVQDSYSHEKELIYACDNGRKPAVEGWWGTSTCQNGVWSHQPQCIDEKACFPPTIPNAKYTKSADGWYEDGDVIRITCDKGYEHKDQTTTSRCINGTWSSLPICGESLHACSEPPKVSHAVIIDQGYQEVFAADSEVQYECEDGYMIKGGDTNQIVTCRNGTWTESPICCRRPGAGHGGCAGGGGDQGHSASSGRGTRPVSGSSSTGHGSGGREIETQLTQIRNCGRHPTIHNGEVVQTDEMFLRYQCNSFYTQVGPQTVKCYTDGTWSELPTCKATFCSVDTDQYPHLEPDGVKFIKNGEKVNLKCLTLDHWWTEHHAVARCINGKLRLSECCDWFAIKMRRC